jgi:subtilisin family serine protease
MLTSLLVLANAISAFPATVSIPGQYIVVFKKQLTAEEHIDNLKKNKQNIFNALNAPIAVKQDYNSIKGFSASTFTIDSTSDMSILQNDDVEAIYPDQRRSINGGLYRRVFDHDAAVGPAWGVARIASRNKPSSLSNYTLPGVNGSGVNAYVIDTGILTTHPDFEGRAVFGADFTGTNPYGGDGNGHGTHVAGTIGSKTYGVAKAVTLIGLSVCDGNGDCEDSAIIAALDYATKKASEQGSRIKSVANLSVGGYPSEPIDLAIKAATKAGLVVVVAAGNSGGDACKLSPARVPSALTVAASDIDDQIASFSEKGKCVDIIAPGVNILSTWNGNIPSDLSDGKTNTLDGTSMASPHAAGVVALFLSSDYPTAFANVADVNTFVKAVGTAGVVSGNIGTTPNLFLFSNTI